MNKPIQITVVDQIQAAEKRYYVALQHYDRAVRSGAGRDSLDPLKQAVCDAFADLKAAHERLALGCDDLQPAGQSLA